MTQHIRNPGALAGASGAEWLSWWASVEDTLERLNAASALAEAIAACPPDMREEWLEAALSFLRAGQPVPPFTSVMAEANCWADWASPGELKAYCLTCYMRMPPADQRAFLRHIEARTG